MSCNKADINPRSCGHRHDNRTCGNSLACQRKGAHFGVQRHSDSKNTCAPYEPGCLGAWASPAPETIQEAIDRLAFHIATGGGAKQIVQVNDGCAGLPSPQ